MKGEVIELILKNLSDESDARKEQWKLINCPELDEADKAIVREISADETNHAILYEAMYQKYANIVATPDNIKPAIRFIGRGGTELGAASSDQSIYTSED